MVVDWGPHDVSEVLYRMWMVCALVCRELELTDWVMWLSCGVDVRCHPDVRGLNAALCGAYYSEQRCGCAVRDLEWSVIGGGFLCCRVKISVLVRCLFGVDVWNFQEVRLLDEVVFKNWQWTVKCVVRWRILSCILLSDCPCVGLGWMFTVNHRAPRSTHGHLDDIERLPHKNVTSPNQWVRAPYKRGHTPSTYDKGPLIHREVPNPRP